MIEADPYALLGVAADAGSETIRRAYRALAFSCHPDRNPDDPRALERFLALGRAFALLADPDRRAAYDRLRQVQAVVPGGWREPEATPAGENAFFVAAPEPAPRRGADVRRTLDIPRDVAARGGQLHFEGAPATVCPRCGGSGSRLATCWVCGGRGSIRTPSGPTTVQRVCPACDGRGVDTGPCPTCRGRGEVFGPRRTTVTVAPGTATGDVLVVPGAGEPGRGGEPAGDLLLVARVLGPDGSV